MMIAGTRLVSGERLPLGCPGDRPQSFGTFAGLPRYAQRLKLAPLDDQREKAASSVAHHGSSADP